MRMRTRSLCVRPVVIKRMSALSPLCSNGSGGLPCQRGRAHVLRPCRFKGRSHGLGGGGLALHKTYYIAPPNTTALIQLFGGGARELPTLHRIVVISKIQVLMFLDVWDERVGFISLGRHAPAGAVLLWPHMRFSQVSTRKKHVINGCVV